MKITNKLISLALTAMLLLGLAAPAMAASDFKTEDGCIWDYSGPGGDVVIPDGVTTIGMSAFMDCTSLTSVYIPSSVTMIGDTAFCGCIGLTSVTIPSSVTWIGWSSFAQTGLTSVFIHSGVTAIGNGAFGECASLTDIYFGGTQEQWTALELEVGGICDKGVTIHYNSAIPGTAPDPTTEPSQSGNAMPTNDKLTVNGALQSPTVYKIGGSNFFKIRDLAAMLNGTEKQFDVGYDSALKSVTLTTGKGYAKLDTDMAGAATGGNQTADPSNDSICIDGQKIDVTVYKIGGNNFFMLRDLGRALDFYVGWTREDGVFIDTGNPYSD